MRAFSHTFFTALCVFVFSLMVLGCQPKVIDKGDKTNPKVKIISPVSGEHQTDQETIFLEAMAVDDKGVKEVTWSTSRGESGIANPKPGMTDVWSAEVNLREGKNQIAIVARDAAGNSDSDAITVTRIVKIVRTEEILPYPDGNETLDQVMETAIKYLKAKGGADFDKIFSEEIMKSAVNNPDQDNPRKINEFLHSLENQNTITSKKARCTYETYFAPYKIVSLREGYPGETIRVLCPKKDEVLQKINDEMDKKLIGLAKATGDTGDWQGAYLQLKRKFEDMKYSFDTMCDQWRTKKLHKKCSLAVPDFLSVMILGKVGTAILFKRIVPSLSTHCYQLLQVFPLHSDYMLFVCYFFKLVNFGPKRILESC